MNPCTINQDNAMSKMTIALFLTLVVGTTTAFHIASPQLSPRASSLPVNEAVGSFALIELFTSEGCSSCPPADALLAEIVHEARREGKRIYPLSFHVDYWDYIGWQDPYASKSFSERQRGYAQALRNSRIYTPQMIVNGATEFVGSDRKKLRAALEAALAEAPPYTISLENITTSSAEWKFSYSVSELPNQADIHVAVVERGLAQTVNRGENSGKRLTHENVVRAFATVNSRAGQISLKVPSDVKRANCSAIAYMQESEKMKVLAATQIGL